MIKQSIKKKSSFKKFQDARILTKIETRKIKGGNDIVVEDLIVD
ncbi:MAG: hypothetical protein AB8H03_28725 [Saprospiraceae bacterium]